ncbi:MAG: DUF2344 domain-containing protein [Clostridia bacterium]|nr:DUF2344 domain-containing protein [Clostridia bacterium]
MVSQNEMIPVRIKFSKTGNLMYISHLDLARTMQRIIVRSGIDIWYSEGFNPQPKIVFAVPLPVGVESKCEYMDIRINSYMSNDEIAKRISDNFPEEMKLISVYTPDKKFKNIAYIDYTISLVSPKITSETANSILELFKGECIITKKTKSGEKEVNISDHVKKLEADFDGEKITLHAILSADSEKYLNPEHFIEGIRQNIGILNSNTTDEYYTILRNNMLMENLEIFE